MKHRRTAAVVAISLAICLTFTGCWDGRELNTISLVAGVGVDAVKGKSGITMTVQVGKTGQTNNGKEKESPTSKYLNYQKSGDTEFGIIRELTHETSRRLFFGHNQFIIFGKQEAEKGIKPQLDFFLRDQETRLDVWLLTSDTTASEILNTESDLSPIPAMDLAQLIANQKANSESVETDILDFTSKMESEGTSPVIGLVKIDRTTKKPKFLLSGMAAFKQDKMVGEMSEPETRGYLWTMNKIHSGTVEVKVGDSGSSLEILEGSGKISPKLDKNNHVSVSIKIIAKLGIREMTDLENVAFPKAGMLLQTACAETIQKRVQACFQKSQVYGTDIYGIGKMIDEKNPKQWDSMRGNWEQIYKKIKPDITVQVQVSDPGQINQFKKMKVGSSVNHDKITSSQFLFTIVCYVESFALLTSFSLTVTHQDTWIAVLLGMVGTLPIIFINLYLIQQYPHQNLIQINQAVYGKPVGSFISVLYCWYFLTLCSLNLRDTGDFLRMSVMSETPSIFVKIPFIILCSYAALKGLKIIVRYSTVFAYIGLFALILTTILVSRRMNYHNLLPVLTTSPVKLVQCVNMVITIPFGTSIFLMIAPAVQDQKKVKKSFLTGFFVGALVILIVVIRDIVVLGKISEEIAVPSYETMCLSGVTETFQRLDILYVIILVILEYFKISLLFYATSVAISQLLSLKSYKPLVLVIGALILVYSFIIFPSAIVHLAVTQTTIPVLWLLFEYIFPFVTFLCTKLRARKEVPAIKL